MSTSNFLPAQWTALNVVDPSFKPRFRRLKAEPDPPKRKAKAKNVKNDKECDDEGEPVPAKNSNQEGSRKHSSNFRVPQAVMLTPEASRKLEFLKRASNSSLDATFHSRTQALFAGGKDLQKAQLCSMPILAASENFTAARQNAAAPIITSRVSTMDYPTPRSRKRRSSEAAQPQENQDINAQIPGYDPISSVLVTDMNGNKYCIPTNIIDLYRLDKNQVGVIDNGANDIDATHRHTDARRPEKRMKLSGEMGDTEDSTKSHSSVILAEGDFDDMSSWDKEQDSCIKEPSEE